MLILDERPASLELDGFTVGRALPSARRRMVGPFIFLDHMGPAELVPGAGLDVRPHPHINLATVTYLFEGQIVHRDSLGYVQPIRPGEINWMTAGRGITHSERTPQELRLSGSRVHGVQLWVALPQAHEEDEPSFDHYGAEVLPSRDSIRLLAGTGWGMTSPVRTLSPLVYADLTLEEGSALELPDEHPELAVLIIEGALDDIKAGRMLVFDRGEAPMLRAQRDTHVVLIGGEPLDGKRHIWWNFVSSSKERIEQAKRDWKEGRFATIPGDDEEFVPLPSR